MNELEQATDRVLLALNDKGANPTLHDYEWQRLMRQWPTLAAALINLGAVREAGKR